MADNIIVYDLETKETFQEIGGRDPRRLTISLLGMFSYADNQYYSYTEDELPAFWRALESCDLLVGFNNKGFDDQVVSAYFPEIMKVPRFDMLEEIYRRLGFRVKLDNLAQATLGAGKSGDGLEAVRLFREGKIEELRSYCLDDVRITKELFDHGRLNHFLYYKDLQGKKEVTVDFPTELEKPETPLNLSLF